MKIYCEKENLLKGINIALRAVPSKTTMAIMECIMICAEDGRITLTSNDGSMAIETLVEGTIEERGSVAVEARQFSEIIRKMPDGGVSISSDYDQNVKINCGKAKFDISGRETDDFTGIPSVNKNHYFSISQFSLKEVVRQTSFSLSVNDYNQLFCGELFEIKGSKLRVVALDGQRMAIRKIELKDTYDDCSVIIPGKTLTELSKILTGDTEDEVIVYMTKNSVLFEFENTTMFSRLIEGKFFDIDNMISSDYSVKVTVDKKEFYSSIDRATLLLKENDKKPLVLDIKDGNMNLSIKTVMGSMQEDIEIEKTGNDLRIGFNPPFLKDVMNVIDDENVSIYMSTSRVPAFIKDDDDTYLYIILPVNFI